MERLQKVLSQAGVTSRRKAEQLIVAGRVRVNGKLVTELGTQVDPERDRVQVDDRLVRVERKTYIVLHKPKGYLSDRAAETDSGQAHQDYPTALDLVPANARLYSVGRLDANSEGLLLLTNDGELAHRLTHPRYEHEKEYLVLVQGVPSPASLARFRKGIWYDGALLRADSVAAVHQLGQQARRQHWDKTARDQTWLRFVLHEGRKREIRHMCAAVGHPVLRLIRVRIGPVELGLLPLGRWRELSEREVRELVQSTSRKR